MPGTPGHIIETDRLRLTLHESTDFGPLAEMWADPAVVRHISGRPATAQESWARLLRYRGLWPVLGFGYWCVRTRDGDRYVGDVGFADFKRDTDPLLGGVPEAGWVLAPWAHGRGYATEALRGALEWLDRSTPFRRAVCLVAPDNRPSLRVAEKTGFLPAGPIRVGTEQAVLLERLT
ncbi:GNAT family N-acetyltransferase [Gluconacetobacter asukensis]|uniref:GNAT family N-acetyltransferase n=1 Tax=Gluconacetobacter asukensis TaxID=1017181 RepID=A0A7W4NZB4_9PROT|nr:GNAT family N-acetyltransferase [Gluconacetobacter asukensis]MBB2171702.1 GNAT family N-acetyltransferase [Gluconacetobacter asukensis]